MRKTRLEKILDDVNVLNGVINHDTGIMIYRDNHALDYLILTYADHYVAYLYDGDRDILVDAKAKNLEDAQELAVEKIEKKLNRNYH